MRRLALITVVVSLLMIGWESLASGQAYFTGCHVNTSTPVVCRVGRGTLYAVTINKKGASGNYTYLWDTSTVTTGAAPLLVIDTTAGPLTLIYSIGVTNGVTVWNTSGVIADLTVITE